MLQRPRGILKAAFLFLLLGSTSAHAVSEFRAIAKEDYPLYAEPRGGATITGTIFKKGTEAYVVGTSVGGTWLKVLDNEGNEGWLPEARVQVFRMIPGDYDRYRELIDRQRRVTSRFIFNFTGTLGDGNLGFGLQFTPMINLFKNGILGNKVDHLEVGGGFAYHFGTSNVIEGFFEVPVLAYWLFRMGPRGAVLFGPGIGFSIIDDPDPIFGDNAAVPIVARLHMRYYANEFVGVYAEIAYLFGDKYPVGLTMGSLGVSMRY